MEPKKETTKNFKFKKFSVFGGLSGMPVSTDGVLLGAWFNLIGNKKKHCVLDIGTGTGLLSLMCAQRFPTSMITAIEIDAQAVKAANINFEASHWSDRIELLQQDILEYCPSQKYDSIICNPPYFLSGEQSQNQQRATARHADSLDHQKLLAKCLELLTASGNASFILPVTEGEQFIEMAKKQGWYLTSICAVKPTETKDANRMLIELSPTKRPLSKTEITIRNSEGYTDSFIELTKSFYLKM